MLKKKTLFVVGAGGSVDFGFPTGPGLLTDIQHALNESRSGSSFRGNEYLLEALQQQARRGDGTTIFAARKKLHSILAGGAVSIDNVIETHKADFELVQVAKTAIALVIAKAEAKSNLRPRTKNSYSEYTHTDLNWLSFLLNNHFAGQPTSTLDALFDKMRFVSFNYDRCISHIVRMRVANYFQLEDSKAIRLSNTLKIIHPYGSLGLLPNGQDGEGSFGEVIGHVNLNKLASNLRTFTEGTEGVHDEKLKGEIEESLDWADHIVFVGFGYIPLNVQMLHTEKIRSRYRVVFGSAFKMTADNASVNRDIVMGTFNAQIVHGFNKEHDAMQFLQEFQARLFA